MKAGATWTRRYPLLNCEPPRIGRAYLLKLASVRGTTLGGVLLHRVHDVTFVIRFRKERRPDGRLTFGGSTCPDTRMISMGGEWSRINAVSSMPSMPRGMMSENTTRMSSLASRMLIALVAFAASTAKSPPLRPCRSPPCATGARLRRLARLLVRSRALDLLQRRRKLTFRSKREVTGCRHRPFLPSP